MGQVSTNKITLKILSIYRKMKINSKRIFIMKDFGLQKDRSIFNLLIKLNLIEQVYMVYRAGMHHNVNKSVKGYRIRHDE